METFGAKQELATGQSRFALFHSSNSAFVGSWTESFVYWREPINSASSIMEEPVEKVEQILFPVSLPNNVLADILTRVGSSGRGILKHVSKSLRDSVVEYQPPRGDDEQDHLKFCRRWRPTLVTSITPDGSQRRRSSGSVRGPSGHSISLSDLCASVDLLVWSQCQGAPWHDQRWSWIVCPLAARGGHLESLKYARREGYG